MIIKYRDGFDCPEFEDVSKTTKALQAPINAKVITKCLRYLFATFVTGDPTKSNETAGT